MKTDQLVSLVSGRRDPPEYNYSQREESLIRGHIKRYFGAPEKVLKENWAKDIRCDVFLINPTPERPYFTLVTFGMGAYMMNVSEDLIECELDRAELVMCLPAYWKSIRLGLEWSAWNEWCWPVTWLRQLAHMPAEQKEWIGWGHMAKSDGPISPKAPFHAILLADPIIFTEQSSWCDLPDGTIVNFYQAIPLFESEMKFRRENGTDALLELFEKKMSRESAAVADPSRAHCV